MGACMTSNAPPSQESDPLKSDSLHEWCEKHDFNEPIYHKLIELGFKSPTDFEKLPIEDINNLCNEQLELNLGTKGRFLNAIDTLKKSQKHDSESKRNMDNRRKHKTLRLYQSSNQWKLIFYEGTPAEEMEKAIREIAGIKPENKFLLLDADGNNVILSSWIADGTQLHLEIIEPLSKPVVLKNNYNNDDDDDGTEYTDFFFKWDTTSRTCSKHSVKDNGMTVGQQENFGWGHTFSDKTMKHGTGIYVWSILFNPIQCCIYSSLNDVGCFLKEPQPILDKEAFNKAFRNGQGFSHGNEKPLEVIYVCDMNKRKLWIFKKGENEEAKILVNNIADEVQPFVTLKHVVWISITGFGQTVIQKNKLNISNTAEEIINYTAPQPEVEPDDEQSDDEQSEY